MMDDRALEIKRTECSGGECVCVCAEGGWAATVIDWDFSDPNGIALRSRTPMF